MSDSDEENRVYEAENEVAELSAPFIMSYGPEIIDSRINAEEYRLLMWIRFRCGADKGNGKIFKYSTLAIDFNVNIRTVKRWASTLIKLGYLISEENGGPVTRKIVVRAEKVYGRVLLESIRKHMKSNRTQDDINYMRSSTGDKNATRIKNIQGDKIATQQGDNFATQQGDNFVPPKVDLKKVDVATLKVNLAKPEEEPLRGISTKPNYNNSFIINNEEIEEDIRNEQYDYTDTTYSELKALPTEDDSQRIASIGQAMTTEQLATRARQKARANRNGLSGYEEAERRQAKEEARQQKIKQRPASGKTAEGWWRERHKTYYPHLTFSKWSFKEMGWAKELIDIYGPIKIQRAFDYVFDKWEKFRQDYAWKKLGQVPNFDFFYWKRSDIMADVELGMISADNVTEPSSKDNKTF